MSALKLAYDLGREEALRRLATPGLFGRLEQRLVPELPKAPEDTSAVTAQVAAERARLRKLTGVTPHLTGSMRTGLNVPGDVDIDFVVPVASREKFDALLSQLHAQDRYVASPYNAEGTAHHVFTAPSSATGGHPVDFAISYGAPAQRYVGALKHTIQNAGELPDDVRQAIVARKHVLRNTPFDIGKYRYKAFKRELEQTLSDGQMKPLKRISMEEAEKTARILDVQNPDDAAHLESFLSNPNLYGHRTTNAESVLSSGKVMPGLEALRRGLLKDYESGFMPGLRSEFKLPELSPDQLRRLSAATLQAQGPDTAMIQSIAKETGSDPLSLKGALIRHRTKDVNQFLETLGDKGEDWRVNHLRIPKLSPNIFLTKGGLIGDKGYGDVGFLMHTDKAQTSPYLTLVNQEAVVAPKSGLRMQTLNARKGLVVAPQERLQELEAAHPDYTYVPESALPKERLMPAISAGELGRRVLPQLAEGTLRVRQG